MPHANINGFGLPIQVLSGPLTMAVNPQELLREIPQLPWEERSSVLFPVPQSGLAQIALLDRLSGRRWQPTLE